MIRPILLAIAALAIAAPAASAHDDAEIFATSNTAVITDAGDPRLDAHLSGFARRVEDIIRDGGARPRGSELLDGVFFDSGLGSTTFERSRVFDVDRASDDELHDIAETIRRRFLQGSVLTFAPAAGGDAVELDVPRVTAKALRKGLLADPEAQQRLFGGSVTLDDHLLLVADRADADFARAFAKRLGGDLKRVGHPLRRPRVRLRRHRRPRADREAHARPGRRRRGRLRLPARRPPGGDRLRRRRRRGLRGLRAALRPRPRRRRRPGPPDRQRDRPRRPLRHRGLQGR